MPIVWKEEMSVGNITIDDEHKLLICLINNLEIALKAKSAKHQDIVTFIVKELYYYTQHHFFQEEKIMLKKNILEFMNTNWNIRKY